MNSSLSNLGRILSHSCLVIGPMGRGGVRKACRSATRSICFSMAPVRFVYIVNPAAVPTIPKTTSIPKVWDFGCWFVSFGCKSPFMIDGILLWISGFAKLFSTWYSLSSLETSVDQFRFKSFMYVGLVVLLAREIDLWAWNTKTTTTRSLSRRNWCLVLRDTWYISVVRSSHPWVHALPKMS